MAGASANLRVVLLSGPICSGKSALVRLLKERHGAKIIKTRELILKKAPKTKPERKALQLAGQRLDKKDGGAWVGEALQRSIDSYATAPTPKGLYVVDSVRIPGQIEAIRRAYCAFRSIRSLIPTTSGQPFRVIRSPFGDAAEHDFLMSGMNCLVKVPTGAMRVAACAP